MAVFTSISFDELKVWLNGYNLGALESFQGISSGVTNTNYLVATKTAKYILTIFEDSTRDELPFYLDLMTYLADRQLRCPLPIKNKSQSCISFLKNKPALLVSFLGGSERKIVEQGDCYQVGRALAHLHSKATEFPQKKANSRGLDWIEESSLLMAKDLPKEDRDIIEDECSFQRKYSSSPLPEGMIHADLFKDNILFDNDQISGMIDFYYACNDKYIYDIAITANDWCINSAGDIQDNHMEELIKGYESVRNLENIEVEALPIFLRLAALRFWVSRLYDFFNIRQGKDITTKDPNHFKSILLKRQALHIK